MLLSVRAVTQNMLAKKDDRQITLKTAEARVPSAFKEPTSAPKNLVHAYGPGVINKEPWAVSRAWAPKRGFEDSTPQ